MKEKSRGQGIKVKVLEHRTGSKCEGMSRGQDSHGKIYRAELNVTASAELESQRVGIGERSGISIGGIG